jgi:hypothetical protein
VPAGRVEGATDESPEQVWKTKCTGLAHTLGQLQASNRDFHSKCWADLSILDQPHESQIRRVGAKSMVLALGVTEAEAAAAMADVRLSAIRSFS